MWVRSHAVLDQHIKLIVVIFVLVSLLILGGIGMKVSAGKRGIELADVPIRSITVTINTEQRENFFEQLRLFADKHAFAIRIAPTDPSNEHFISQMWREDIKIIAVNSFEPENYRIAFYKNNVGKVPKDVLSLLITELESFVSEVPGATFSVIKGSEHLN